MRFNKNSLTIQTNYLLTCDYINKYDLKNIYKKPKIQSILITCKLKTLINAFNLKNISEKNIEIQIKSFLLFYLYSTQIPFINNKIIISKKLINNKLNYLIKINLNTVNDINTFLLTLFIENSKIFSLNNIKLLKTFKQTETGSNKNFFIKLPLNLFYDFNYILKNIITKINTKNLFFNIYFKLNLNMKLNNFNKLISNLPYFWINN